MISFERIIRTQIKHISSMFDRSGNFDVDRIIKNYKKKILDSKLKRNDYLFERSKSLDKEIV